MSSSGTASRLDAWRHCRRGCRVEQETCARGIASVAGVFFCDVAITPLPQVGEGRGGARGLQIPDCGPGP